MTCRLEREKRAGRDQPPEECDSLFWQDTPIELPNFPHSSAIATANAQGL